MEERQKRYLNRVQPGQTGFFTTTVLDFVRAFDRREMKEEMVRSLLQDLHETGSKLRAFVIMPHHIHFVAILPEDSERQTPHEQNQAERSDAYPRDDDRRGALWKPVGPG